MDFTSRVLAVPKQHTQSAAFGIYQQHMGANTPGKTRFFLGEMLNARRPLPFRTVDVGCCVGDLPFQLSRHLQGGDYLGLDANPAMIQRAIQQAQKRHSIDQGTINYTDPISYLRHCISILLGKEESLVTQFSEEYSPFQFEAANVLTYPYEPESVDVFTLSSIMHELASYCEEGLGAIEHFFGVAYHALKPGGRVVIKDPAKPENPDEILTVVANKYNDQSFRTTDPNFENLSTNELLIRFLAEFKHLGDAVVKSNGNNHTMPAWLVSEFIRHRTLCDTKDHWDSEMQERYGTYTLQEMLTVAESHGFEIARLDTAYNPNNHAAGYNGEFAVYDNVGKEVKQSERFPSHIYVSLERPYIPIDCSVPLSIEERQQVLRIQRESEQANQFLRLQVQAAHHIQQQNEWYRQQLHMGRIYQSPHLPYYLNRPVNS